MARQTPPKKFVTPDKLSDEEIKQRWKSLTPMFVKWMIICAVLAGSALSALYLIDLKGKALNFVAVASQVTVAGAGCFTFLSLMGWFYTRRTK